MSKKISISNIKDLHLVAQHLLDISNNGPKLFLLYGDLGAGKTTLVKKAVHLLGSDEETSSPTYSLVNEYNTSVGVCYHIDLYRIQDTHEAIDIGIEEYLDSGAYCFIEWPQVIESLVENHWTIRISTDENGVRTFEIKLTNVD